MEALVTFDETNTGLEAVNMTVVGKYLADGSPVSAAGFSLMELMLGSYILSIPSVTDACLIRIYVTLTPSIFYEFTWEPTTTAEIEAALDTLTAAVRQLVSTSHTVGTVRSPNSLVPTPAFPMYQRSNFSGQFTAGVQWASILNDPTAAVYFVVKAKSNDRTPTLDVSCSIENADEGVIGVSLTRTQTANLLPGEYFWQIEARTYSGDPAVLDESWPILEGKILVKPIFKAT